MMTNPVEQAFSVVGLATHLGRGISRVTTDAVVGQQAGPAPHGREISTLRSSPRSWGAPSDRSASLASDAGTSSRARLVLTGNGVPESVFVKLAAQTAATRLMGELGRLGHTEVRFYSQLAPQTHRGPERLRRGIRHLDRPVPAGSGRPARRVVRISRHLAPAFRRPGQPRRRIAGQPARQLSGTACRATGAARWAGSTRRRATSPLC